MRTWARQESFMLGVALVGLVAGRARAQSAGGFSAGPGLAGPRHELTAKGVPPPGPIDGGTAPVAGGLDAGPGLAPSDELPDQPGDYETRVETFRRSPAFSQDRDFPGTRFWRLDPGNYEVEAWWTGQTLSPRLGGGQDNFFQTEIEAGVVPHVQIDIYLNVDNPPHTPDYNLDGLAVEIRYSLARDYGVIWGNPVLYLEFTPQYFNSPRLEGRLLGGGDLLTGHPGLLVGAINFYYEQNLLPTQTPDGIDAELGIDAAASVQLIPGGLLRLGAEAKVGLDDHAVPRLTPGLPQYRTLLVGPNFIVKLPSNDLKLMGTIFFGTQPFDPAVMPMLVLGTMFH